MQGCRACRGHTHTHTPSHADRTQKLPPPPPSPSAKRFPCQGATRRPEARPCWSASCVLALLSARRPARCDKRGAKVEALAKIPRLQRCSKLLIAKGKNSVERPRSPKPRPTSRSPRHFCVPRRDGRIPKAACSRSGSRGADRQTVRRYTWRQVAQKMSSILFLQSLNKKRALGLELLRLSLLDTDNLRLLRCQRRLRKAGRQHAGSNTPTAPLHKPFPKGRGGVFPTS